MKLNKHLFFLILFIGTIPAHSQLSKDQLDDLSTEYGLENLALADQFGKALPQIDWLFEYVFSSILADINNVKMRKFLLRNALLLGVGIQCLCRPTSLGGYGKTIAIGTAAQAAFIVGLLKIGKQCKTSWYPYLKDLLGKPPALPYRCEHYIPAGIRTGEYGINKAKLLFLSLYPTLIIAAGALCITLAKAGAQQICCNF